MSGPELRCLALATLLLGGCSGGDLTLPSSRPAALDIVSGDGQEAEAGSLLAEPLVVRILDGSARPVAGTRVEFEFVGEAPGAALDPASVLTDDEGRASAVVRLGTAEGEQLIVAGVADTESADLRARFNATALAPDDRGDGGGGGKKGSRGKDKDRDKDDGD